MEKNVLVKIVPPSGRYRDILIETQRQREKYEFKLIPPSVYQESDKFPVLDLLVTRFVSNYIAEKYDHIINIIDGQIAHDFELGKYFRDTLGFKDFFSVAYPMHKDDKDLLISGANFGVKKMGGLVSIIQNLLQKEVKPMRNLVHNPELYEEKRGIIVPKYSK